MIQVDHIIKSFDGTQVLQGISTVFEKGKTNLIIGQSGSGKTVFLKCLLGLFQTDSGKILFENKAVLTVGRLSVDLSVWLSACLIDEGWLVVGRCVLAD